MEPNLTHQMRDILEAGFRKGEQVARMKTDLETAKALLCDASVHLREGKIRTRRNRADMIDMFLDELRGRDDE